MTRVTVSNDSARAAGMWMKDLIEGRVMGIDPLVTSNRKLLQFHPTEPPTNISRLVSTRIILNARVWRGNVDVEI